MKGLGLLLLSASAWCSTPRPADPVILELGEDTVRRSEFVRHLAEVETRGGGPLDPDVRRSLLDSFLEERALVLEARQRGLLGADATPADEQRAVQKILADASADVQVADAEVEAYYASHTAEFVLAETVTLRQILVPTQNEARDVRRRLVKEPRAFESIAREVSRGPEAPSGGFMGTFAKGQLPVELENGAFVLPEGATSDIVPSSLGYHILRIEARQAARPQGLGEVRERIRTRLLRDKSDARAREFVASLLRRAKVNHAAALSSPAPS
jgi:hypothetical protein